jgi:hypothetical protein
MNNQEMLDFLMEHDVDMVNWDTNRVMTADEAFVLGGEFVVYERRTLEPSLYRGTDFEEALKYLEGNNE